MAKPLIKKVARIAANDPPELRAQVEAVMKMAEDAGFLADKSGRIGGRVSPALIRQAKRRTGITGDSELIAFALANLAVEDDFPRVFKESRGTVPRDIKLGY